MEILLVNFVPSPAHQGVLPIPPPTPLLWCLGVRGLRSELRGFPRGCRTSRNGFRLPRPLLRGGEPWASQSAAHGVSRGKKCGLLTGHEECGFCFSLTLLLLVKR